MNLWTWTKRNHLGTSAVLSLATGLVVLYFALGRSTYFSALNDEERRSMYDVSATAAVTTFGFVLAAMSVVLSFIQSDRLRLLRESGLAAEFFKIYASSLRWLGALSIVSLIGALPQLPLGAYGFSVLVLVASVCLMRLVLCIWGLASLAKIAMTG